jgi:predicted PhzF superfamily epimerase YddE/YHI9
MTLLLTVVDAFTDRPFSGNQAAVALVDAFPPAEHMQAVAAEMNLAETAFVVRRPDGDFDLRWFSPMVEIDLCGHATLASAHVLGGAGRFRTRSGVLTCSRDSTGRIEMDFPAMPALEASPPSGLDLDGIRWFGRGQFDVLIELADADAVRAYRPLLDELAALAPRGVIITAAGDRHGVDCVSRFFAPNAGVPEDAVTGSAHCTLAVFWAERLGRTTLVGHQASARTGTVHMRLEGDRVMLGGQAVTVSRVEMVV